MTTHGRVALIKNTCILTQLDYAKHEHLVSKTLIISAGKCYDSQVAYHKRS